MKDLGRIAILLVLLLPFAIPLTVAEAGISEPFSVQFSYVECEPDGNNAHVSATLIKRMAGVFDAVCPEDPFDWYLLPLEGDLTWDGDIICITDGPGLVVRLYYDIGAGPQMISEGSPVEVAMPDETLWRLQWDVRDLAAGIGLAALPAAVYYLRVTYYSAYPTMHPYQFWAGLRPLGHLPSPYNTPGTARPLGPGLLRYGHLDSADPTDWYAFDVPPGQTGTGIIFGEDIRGSGLFSRRRIEVIPLDGGLKQFDVNLYNAAQVLIATMEINRDGLEYIDLATPGQLSPGTYYIEVTNFSPMLDPDFSANYMIFNHALAPDSGAWGPDENVGIYSAQSLLDGVPISGTVYSPRDQHDFFSFSSSGYFLGDFTISPAIDFMGLFATLADNEAFSVGGQWIPGFGISCRMTPKPPGFYYFVISDFETLFSPINYTATFYRHGVPMTEPTGHQTWQTAQDLAPGQSGDDFSRGRSAYVDFQPGVQDVHYFTLEVPSSDVLVGYYELTGSRTHYRARLGKIGPGGIPNWSPSLLPDSLGVLKIDLNYDFLSDAGTYFLKLEMLPSSPGRMRVHVSNQARIAECVADDNHTYDEAEMLTSVQVGTAFVRSSELCPSLDDVDWYKFDTGIFDDFYGPRQHLLLKGSAPGMRMELYDGNLTFLRSAEVAFIGDSVIIDVDGLILDQWTYYIKVIAQPLADRVQIYDLELRKDIELTLPLLDIPLFLEFELPFKELLRENLDL